MNKRSGRKKANKEDLKKQLGEELTDVIHYTLAIGALNGLDMNQIILEKDKTASIKYDHKINLEQFVIKKTEIRKLIYDQNRRRPAMKLSRKND